MEYHLSYTTDITVHLNVEAESPEEARRRAAPELHRLAGALTSRLESVLSDLDEVEVGEEWHHAQTHHLNSGRAT